MCKVFAFHVSGPEDRIGRPCRLQRIRKAPAFETAKFDCQARVHGRDGAGRKPVRETGNRDAAVVARADQHVGAAGPRPREVRLLPDSGPRGGSGPVDVVDDDERREQSYGLCRFRSPGPRPRAGAFVRSSPVRESRACGSG